MWGNERADELAKIGTTSTNLVKGYIPQSHIKGAGGVFIKILSKLTL